MKIRSNPSWALAILMLLYLGCNGETTPDAGPGDTTPPDDVADVQEEDAEQPTDLGDAGDQAGDIEVDPGLDVPEDTPVDSAPDALEDPTLDAEADQEADVGDMGPSPCVVGFDCDPGEICDEGYCEPFVAECTQESGCDGDLECVAGICVEPGYSPYGDLIVINEVLIDGNTDEDANGDGTVDSVEDAFVELVNTASGPIDISNWTLVERHFSTGLPRHTFVADTELLPGDAVVVFGGGDPPDSTDTILFLAANARDEGDHYGLDLDVDGDRLRLLDENGRIVAEFAYGGVIGLPVVTDESATRSPDLVGNYTKHTAAAGSEGAIFSPGTRVDGSPFLPE